MNIYSCMGRLSQLFQVLKGDLGQIPTSQPSTQSFAPTVNLAAYKTIPETYRKEDNQFLPYDPYVIMDLAYTGFMTLGQVFNAIILIAQASVQGITVKAVNPQDQEYIDMLCKKIHFSEKAEMLMANAMIFGSCPVEFGKNFLKIRDRREFFVEYDKDLHKITEWKQNMNNNFIDPSSMELFVLQRLWSDDTYGISLLLPALQSIDDILELRKGSRAILKRFRKPFFVLKRPENASEPDIQAVIDVFASDRYDGIYEIPEDWGLEVHGPGQVQFKIDELAKLMVDQLYLDLGVPKTFFIPGSLRSETEQHIKLLYERLRPKRQKAVEFWVYGFQKHYGVEVEIQCDEIRTENSTIKLNLVQGLLAVYRTLDEMKKQGIEEAPLPQMPPMPQMPQMPPLQQEQPLNALPTPKAFPPPVEGMALPEMAEAGVPPIPMIEGATPLGAMPQNTPPVIDEFGEQISEGNPIDIMSMMGLMNGDKMPSKKSSKEELDEVQIMVLTELKKLIKRGI